MTDLPDSGAGGEGPAAPRDEATTASRPAQDAPSVPPRMILCPYCGYSNYEGAEVCRKCDAPFASQTTPVTARKASWFGSQKARDLRGKALAIIVLGIMIKVYWGGYGPWPVVDSPTLSSLRSWLEPLLIYGGAVLYVAGQVLRWV